MDNVFELIDFNGAISVLLDDQRHHIFVWGQSILVRLTVYFVALGSILVVVITISLPFHLDRHGPRRADVADRYAGHRGRVFEG